MAQRGVLLLITALSFAPGTHAFLTPGGLRVSGWQPGSKAWGGPATHARAGIQLVDRRRYHSAPRMMLDVDPVLFVAAAQGAATAAATAVKGAAVTGAAAKVGAAGAAGAATASPSPDVIQALKALQASIIALPATVASIPAMKTAIAAATAALAKTGATAQTAALAKQLAAVSKALTAAAAKSGAAVSAATPAPVRAAAMAAAAVVGPIAVQVAAGIKAVSGDTDNELFNGYPFNAPALTIWAASVVAFSSISGADDEVPYPAGGYDPVKADAYFQKRWFLKFGRSLQLLSSLGGWGIGLARDKYEFNGANWQKNQPMRAKQILRICTKLGTTAIKIGQALSIRGDLLPAPYVKELSELQDKVQPFPSPIARDIIAQELKARGRPPLKQSFANLSPEPVAAASIGQVYKGTLPDGQEVAVKVQRPDVVQDIALDLYMCRAIAPIYKKAFKLNTDLEGLIDEWGAGFVNELDYIREATNGQRFLSAMQERGLNAVTTSEVVPHLSSERILVTKWVDGEKLSVSKEGDVGRLCGVALNAYLTMLLDTGLLHCDPHPGNFLRTTDGRLCILDFGMCIEVDKDLQYGLIEYIAHLVSEDYEKIPGDLIRLGFVPKGQEAAIQRAGTVAALSIILKQLAQGGGPKQVQKRIEDQVKAEFGDIPREELREKIKARFTEMNENQVQEEAERVGVTDVANKMEELSGEDGNAFQIPPWMAYILRTFTVLEGVGLNQDENYSITQECYPYLAKRLLTDSSPRAQNALRSMLYGGQVAGQPQSIDVKRLREISAGFQSYTTATSEVSERDGMDQAATQVSRLLLAPEGNFIQQVLLEELAAVIDAAGRASFALAAANPAAQFAVEALRQQQTLSQNLPGPLKALFAPALLPGELFLSSIPLMAEDEEDKAALRTANGILELLREIQSGAMIDDGDVTKSLNKPATDGGPLAAAAGMLRLPKDAEEFQSALAQFQSLQPSAATLAARLASIVLQRVACRVEERVAASPLLFSPQARQVAETFVGAVDSLEASVATFIASQETEAHRANAAVGDPKILEAVTAAPAMRR
eukprot:CAMPEP_0180133642 /NCGR_PEP_ID=MMETSP0986-20121125/9659_1 /TAXON_ID=697907 /ORGANISM="non described non described, Strain CCMP2293" /LENGTH=1057 /DNA_ID=CAMNT_0022073793 /DNA_START=37 /DNA_END=3210 /DNA_ORIENTATION=+